MPICSPTSTNNCNFTWVRLRGDFAAIPRNFNALDARKAKSSGYKGHALMENRNGLVGEACLTKADGHAERNAALAMIEPRASTVATSIIWV